MDHIPALASLFRSALCAASWSRSDDDWYSEMHARYWGRKIELEAQEWRRSHHIVDDPTNNIGPGCFVLDLGVDIFPSRLWVREDYIRIYDYCISRHAELPSDPKEMARSVVITGKPGVGKTYWVTYAIRRCLGEQRPFLWYKGGECLIFCGDGVFVRPVESVVADRFKPFLWAFVDADSETQGVPHRLIAPTCLFVIFTTSPTPQRWKTLEKTTSCLQLIMDIWSLEEIRQAARISLCTDQQRASAEEIFERFGPIPRICIDCVRDPSRIPVYEAKCCGLATRVTPDSLRRFITLGGELDINAVSHMVFMIRRYQANDLLLAYVEPTSATVRTWLMGPIDTMLRLDRIALYYTLASANSTKAVAGLLYESLGHAQIVDGITLVLRPLTRPLHHWTRAVQGPNSMDDSLPVIFPSNPAIIFNKWPERLSPNQLYIPGISNQAGHDSYFLRDSDHHRTFFIFQFTVADSHDIKDRVVRNLTEHLDALPPKEDWCFVFITPPSCSIDVKVKDAVKDFLEGVKMYTAYLEIERQTEFEAWASRGSERVTTRWQRILALFGFYRL